MPDTTHRGRGIARLVAGGLGLVALGVGWLFSHWPAVGMGSDVSTAEQLRAIGLGLVATLPPLAALAVMDRVPIPSLEKVKDLALQAIRQIFPQPRWWQLALVAAAAGFGEELLFRGLVQAGLAKLIGAPAGPWAALVAASLVFGLFHWLNKTYALLAMVAGLYFGALLVATGSLWPPIVAHALYDFIALCYLLRPTQVIELP